MPQNEARAWWAEAADLRESIERRRGEDPATADDARPGDELAHVRARRALAERERTPAARSQATRSGRFDREPAERVEPPRRTGRFDREPVLHVAPSPDPGPLELPPNAPRRALVAPVPRRTVQITGRPGERRLVEIQRRRAMRTPTERLGPRPDRIASWAVALAFFLILVAYLSAHG